MYSDKTVRVKADRVDRAADACTRAEAVCDRSFVCRVDRAGDAEIVILRAVIDDEMIAVRRELGRGRCGSDEEAGDGPVGADAGDLVGRLGDDDAVELTVDVREVPEV